MISPFVDLDWLREHRDEVVLADGRWYADGRSGREAYATGHLPGAVFVDLDTALSGHGDPAAAGRHPLPDSEDFAGAMAAVGIGDEDTVIAYDDAGSVIAARLVWMLRATGHDAALLDGGLAAWDGALETGEEGAFVLSPEDDVKVRTHGGRHTFTARPWPTERLATIDEAAELAAAGGIVIDARPAERFAGAPDDLDPRAGHIPGARSVPCRENVGPDGRLLPADQLRERFAVDDAGAVISYCGSGITACHNLLAMEAAGLGVGRLFPGSWSQWSRDPERPVQTVGE